MGRRQPRKGLALLLALCMILCAAPFTAQAAGGTVYKPATWVAAQEILVGMQDGDTLDLCDLGVPTGEGHQTLTISKSITVNTTASQYTHFKNLYFIIQNGATLTLQDIGVTNADSTKSIVSGVGNLIVRDCYLTNTPLSDFAAKPQACIDLDGDATVYGTITANPNGGVNFSTQIMGMVTGAERTNTSDAGDAIHAVNVTVYGGTIGGATDASHKGNGGNAIVASGNVFIKGQAMLGTIDGTTPDSFNSAIIHGGEGNHGGSAILAQGNVVIDGGCVMGGDAFGTEGFGGSAVKADGNVTIAGEKLQSGAITFFGTYLFPGRGVYCPGVTIQLTGSAQQILRVKNAQVTGRDEGQYAAAYTIQMKENDLAVIDGSKVGWYTNIPLFSAGSYQITNAFATWGTLDNATPVTAIDSLVSPDAKAVAITAKASIPEPTYTITIPTTIDAGDLEQKAASDADKIKSAAFTVSASNVANLFGEKKIAVSISPAGGTFSLSDGANLLAYSVFNAASGGSALANNGTFAEFTANDSKAGRIEIDQSAITRAGTYSGTLTFTIALADVGSSIDPIQGVPW